MAGGRHPGAGGCGGDAVGVQARGADRGRPHDPAFFRYFVDDGRSYLARTWLLNDVQVAVPAAKRRDSGSKEPWNGQDWYVSFGDDPAGSRSWTDARRYGFVSAGGGEWYSRSLKGLPVGARIFTCIPRTGYVDACAYVPTVKEVTMVDSPVITNVITRSSENKLDRR